MKKLLSKTIQPIALFSLALLLISIPVYFLMINSIWEEELDEHHYLSAKKIEGELNAFNDSVDVSGIVGQFNQLSLNSSIAPLAGVAAVDSVYSVTRFDSAYGETESFRGYSSVISIRGKQYVFHTETSIEESEETIFVLAMVTFSFLILLIAGIYLINWRTAKQVWQPFYTTLDKLKAFDLSENTNVHFDSTRIAEFAELNTAVTNLINQNIRTYRQQREFTENASHELQTPLAILKTRIDLLLQDESLTKEQLENIADLNTALSRASRINKNLLLLAKLDSRKIEATAESIDLHLLTEELLGFLEVSIQSKRIQVATKCLGNFAVTADKNLLETVVLNLLLNAVRHTPDGGKIRVSIADTTITVLNSGTQALNADSLYKRFASASRTSPGSGLGLAIVKEISNRYGWQVAYQFQNGFHSFSVAF